MIWDAKTLFLKFFKNEILVPLGDIDICMRYEGIIIWLLRFLPVREWSEGGFGGAFYGPTLFDERTLYRVFVFKN